MSGAPRRQPPARAWRAWRAWRARRARRYVLRAVTGRDLTGVFWRGTDTVLDREVVIREVTLERLPPGERDAFHRRLLRELGALARIRYPGAVPLLDVTRERDRTLIVSPRLEAVTLAELVEHHGPYAPAEAAVIGRQLLDVLEAVHEQGVVHRDLRPENVLVLRDGGNVVLANFGIAMRRGDSRETPVGPRRSPFAPPEAVKAGGPEDDLWSVGAILYWLVEGRAPFGAEAWPGSLPRFTSAGGLAPVLEALLSGPQDRSRSTAEIGGQLDEIVRAHRRAGGADPRTVVLAPAAAGSAPAAAGSAPARRGAPPATASRRALSALVAEGFASRLSFGLVGFALPLYARSLGLSLAAIGLLASLNTIVAMLLKPAMGAAADRYGRKRTLGVAMAVRSVLALLYGMATAPWALYAVRAGHGFADSMRDPSVTALIADNGGKKAVASAFAWYQTAKTVAGSVGKSVAGVLLAVSAGSYAAVFATAFVLSALPLLIVAVFVRDGDSRATAAVAPATVTDGVPARPPTRPYVLLGFLVSGAASMLGTLFPILATEYAGLSPAQAGALYLVTPALALTGPVFGWLADHVSNRLVLSLRSAANVGSSLLYLLVPAVPGFFAGKALDDLGKAAFKPAWGAIMAEVSSADRDRRARTMSWMSVGEDAGDIAAPIVAGLLWTAWGAPAVLIARAGLALAAEVWALWLTRRVSPPRSPTWTSAGGRGQRDRGRPSAR